MAKWQIIKNKEPIIADNGHAVTFDDGEQFSPGQPGFSQEAIKAECKRLGLGYTFNHLGNSAAPVVEEVAVIPGSQAAVFLAVEEDAADKE